MPKSAVTARNELIIHNNDNAAVRAEPVVDSNNVDLEIIFLGPKRPAPKDKSKTPTAKSLEAQTAPKSAKEDSSTRERDSQPLAAKVTDDNLLNQLERRYKQSGADEAAEDGAYVDYMDYF